jgi:alpha-1,3-rhamnosyl/mannosyltransferase
MRVIFNRLAAAEARTGVGHYTAQLLHCLRQQAEGDVLDPFPGPRGQRWTAAWMALRRKQMPAAVGPAPAGDWPAAASVRQRLFGCLRTCGRLARAAAFRRLCRWKKYDLYHEPNFLPLPCDCPTVITLHDLSVLLHPEWHPAERVAHFEQEFRRGLAQAVHFFTVSDFVRGEVIRTLGIPPERVTRTYNGIRSGLAPLPQHEVAAGLRRLGLPPRYLLHVGTIEPRKNVLTLLRAYRGLPASVRADSPLVLVGGWGWNAAAVADHLHTEASAGDIHYRNYVAEGDLAVLYNGARALVFPSLYEGFGLPPVEMLACGGAVLASTAGAVAETAGGKAQLIDPLDTGGWRDAMLRVCTDEEWWQALRQGATEAARRFTWERCAADTLAVYRTLGAGRVRAAA